MEWIRLFDKLKQYLQRNIRTEKILIQNTAVIEWRMLQYVSSTFHYSKYLVWITIILASFLKWNSFKIAKFTLTYNWNPLIDFIETIIYLFLSYQLFTLQLQFFHLVHLLVCTFYNSCNLWQKPFPKLTLFSLMNFSNHNSKINWCKICWCFWISS